MYIHKSKLGMWYYLGKRTENENCCKPQRSGRSCSPLNMFLLNLLLKKLQPHYKSGSSQSLTDLFLFLLVCFVVFFVVVVLFFFSQHYTESKTKVQRPQTDIRIQKLKKEYYQFATKSMVLKTRWKISFI